MTTENILILSFIISVILTLIFLKISIIIFFVDLIRRKIKYRGFYSFYVFNRNFIYD